MVAEDLRYAPAEVQENAHRLGVTDRRQPADHVYVCAYSALTPLGDENQTYERILKGEVGIRRFDVGNFRTSFAAPVDIDLNKFYEADELRDMSYVSALSDIIVRRAVQNAGIVGDDGKLRADVARDRFSICMGSGAGPVLEFIDAYNDIHSVRDSEGNEDLVKGSREVDGRVGRRVFAQDVTARPAISIGAQGEGTSSSEACATGLSNLVLLYRSIKGGYSDAGVGGGVEGVLGSHPNKKYGYHPEVPIGVFAKMHATSDEKEDSASASLTLGAKRKGFILGEGGAGLLLASDRFVDMHPQLIPIAEVLNADKGMDAFHPTDPLPDRVARILLRSLVDERSGKLYFPDLYVGHYTATKVGDAKEAEALEIAFGEQAHNIWLLAPKRFLGHQLGGAGAVTALLAVMCMQYGNIPGINIQNIDPRFAKFQIPQNTVEQKIDVALAAAFGFGGIGAGMSFGRI